MRAFAYSGSIPVLAISLHDRYGHNPHERACGDLKTREAAAGHRHRVIEPVRQAAAKHVNAHDHPKAWLNTVTGSSGQYATPGLNTVTGSSGQYATPGFDSLDHMD